MDVCYSKPIKYYTYSFPVFNDLRDNHAYEYAEIGDQVWMTQNLAYLPSVSPPYTNDDTWVYNYFSSDTSEAKANENYYRYGALYSCGMAQNVCPSGWHLPSDEEWKQLESYLGMSEDEIDIEGIRTSGNIGTKLRSILGWGTNMDSPIDGGSNEVGFNSLPGHFREVKYENFGGGDVSCYWTSNPTIYRNMTTNPGIYRAASSGADGRSIRCVRDQENQYPPIIHINSPANNSEINSRFLVIEGTAYDEDGSVIDIQIRLNNGEWTSVSGDHTNWTHPFSLEGGFYSIDAKALDNFGNESEIESISVNFVINNMPVVSAFHVLNENDLQFTLNCLSDSDIINVYSSSLGYFTPDNANGSNRIATNATDEDLATPGIQWTDPGAVGDPQENYFYIFTSVGSAESENSATIGKFDFNLITTATTDFNEIALPLQIQGVSTAVDLMALIPGCNSVARWDASAQGYEQYISFIPETNFSITPGYPYYVNVISDDVFTLVGELAQPSFNLITTPTTDFNEVMLTLDKTSITTASQLMSDIQSCNSIARWSSVSQGYEQYISFIPETKFNVRTGYPYYVNVTSDVVWPVTGGGSLKSISAVNHEQLERRGAPHLVYGTIDISNSGLSIQDLDFSAYFPSTPEEKLSKNSAGCWIRDGYYIIQCNTLPLGWGVEEPLKIDFKDQNNITLQSTEVQLTYNPADRAMDLVLEEDKSFSLLQNVPNPFSDETIIEYHIPEDGNVILEVYSLTGQRIRTLVNDFKKSGSHKVTWKRTDVNQQNVPDGIYIYLLRNKEKVIYKKATVIR